jgi:hypothetical protein
MAKALSKVEVWPCFGRDDVTGFSAIGRHITAAIHTQLVTSLGRIGINTVVSIAISVSSRRYSHPQVLIGRAVHAVYGQSVQ